VRFRFPGLAALLTWRFVALTTLSTPLPVAFPETERVTLVFTTPDVPTLEREVVAMLELLPVDGPGGSEADPPARSKVEPEPVATALPEAARAAPIFSIIVSNKM